MTKKVFLIELSDRSVAETISELKEYQRVMNEKRSRLQRLIAEKICQKSQQGFTGAIVDDLTTQSGGARFANVTVSVKDGDGVTVVVASGTDAVWVEFGAGVYHNGAQGSSPNPYGNDLGFTIGGFGTNGKKATWGFKENGELKITRGTPATRPMFNAVQEIVGEIERLVKEVYG